MPQTRLRLLLVFIVILAAVAWWVFFRPSNGRRPAATPTFPPPPQVTITPPALEDLARQFPRLERLLRDPNVDSAYKDFVVAYERGGLEAAEQLARTRGLLSSDNDVRITLVVDTADTARLQADLEGLGVVILGVYRDLIDISIPFEVIVEAAQSDNPAAAFERVRDLEHVVGLQFSAPSAPHGLHRAGRVAQANSRRQNAGNTTISEGVSAIHADAWHAAGFTGRGMKVGILDQGFDGYRALLGGELPDQVSVRSFVAGVEPDAIGENHGTAVTEIVYDVAPGAELFLAYYDGGDVSMGNAVEWLLEQGVQIISHSAGGLAGPMDGSGRDAELVDGAAAQGVLWINSAGNSASEHYRAVFTDDDGDEFHDFNPKDSLLAFRPAPDQPTQIVLNWDDWPQSAEDYDLYLLDRDGIVLASSRNAQAGQRAPVEQILYRFDDHGAYYVAVQAIRTTYAARLDLYIHEARSMDHTSPSRSLATPADARGALTVGAVFFQDNTLESFSSYGPTNDGRPKPELVGPDGVSVATYAPQAFFGTSAAAPHVAGAAALVWSAHPEFDADDMRTFLLSNTIPVAGEAKATGAGVLRLPAPPQDALEALPTAAAVTITQPSAATGNSAGAIAAACVVGIGGMALVSALAMRQRLAARHSPNRGATASIACAACGAQLRSGAQFCGQCGRPPDATASRACARCGWQLRPGAAYCSNCGAAV